MLYIDFRSTRVAKCSGTDHAASQDLYVRPSWIFIGVEMGPHTDDLDEVFCRLVRSGCGEIDHEPRGSHALGGGKEWQRMCYSDVIAGDSTIAHP